MWCAEAVLCIEYVLLFCCCVDSRTVIACGYIFNRAVLFNGCAVLCNGCSVLCCAVLRVYSEVLQPYLTLLNGAKMPALGMGTWELSGE